MLPLYNTPKKGYINNMVRDYIEGTWAARGTVYMCLYAIRSLLVNTVLDRAGR